jgi:hypothetical protein
MHVHDQDRLTRVTRLGEGEQVAEVDERVPMGEAEIRPGVMV